jgi:hypothetical protein
MNIGYITAQILLNNWNIFFSFTKFCKESDLKKVNFISNAVSRVIPYKINLNALQILTWSEPNLIPKNTCKGAQNKSQKERNLNDRSLFDTI